MTMVLSVCSFYSSYQHLTLSDCTGTPKSDCGGQAGVGDYGLTRSNPTASGPSLPRPSVSQQQCAAERASVLAACNQGDCALDFASSAASDVITDPLPSAMNCVEDTHLVDLGSHPAPSAMAEMVASPPDPSSASATAPAEISSSNDGVYEIDDGQVLVYCPERSSAGFVVGIIDDGDHDEQDDEACLKIDETYVETDYQLDADEDSDSDAVVFELAADTTREEGQGQSGALDHAVRTAAPQRLSPATGAAVRPVTLGRVAPGGDIQPRTTNDEAAQDSDLHRHLPVEIGDSANADSVGHEVMCRLGKRKSESVSEHRSAPKSCRRIAACYALDAGYCSDSDEAVTSVTATDPGHPHAESDQRRCILFAEEPAFGLNTSNPGSGACGVELCSTDSRPCDFSLGEPLTCVADAVPMVALECELPLSGRLSPPVDGSVEFLPMVGDFHGDTVEVSVSDSQVSFSVNSCSGGKRRRDQRNDSDDESSDGCDEQHVNSSQHRGRSRDDEGECLRREHKRRKTGPADAEGERGESCLVSTCSLAHACDQNCDVLLDVVSSPAPDTTTTTTTTTTIITIDSTTTESHASEVPDSTDSAECEDGLSSSSLSSSCFSSSGTSHFKTPRISPFHNTPKQRKEERRRVLKLSIHKMRAVEDPEHFLRRSVLINNTMKRLQRELREEKLRSGPRRAAAACYGLYRHRGPALHYDVLNNSYLLQDEPFAVTEHDRITDDMTDALVTRLEATSTTSAGSTTAFSSPPPAPAPAVSSSSPHSSPSPTLVTSSSSCDSDDVFVGSPLLPDTTSVASSSCSSESQRAKQFFSDMDVVFNNLIRALGES